MSPIESRAYRCDAYGYCYNYSTWGDWGRWVALAVIVSVVLLFAFAFSCLNNRRRRRRGMNPMYGTGWFAGKPPQGQHYGNTQNYYGNQPYNGGAAAPPYSPPVGGHHTGHDGYYGENHNAYGYGNQQDGIHLQQPQSSYQPQRGGDPVYEAPMGPPPAKGEHIIR